MKKQSLYFYFFIVVVVIFLASLRPVSESAEDRAFLISPGQGFREIAARLEADSLIRTRVGFSIYGFISGNGHMLKPGLYELNSAMSSREVLKILKAGQTDITITIIEGDSAKDIDAKLSRLGLVEKNSFFKISERFEGMIFPDTYRLSPKFRPEEILVVFLENFSNRSSDLLPKLSGTLQNIISCAGANAINLTECAEINKFPTDEYEKLITASILEKEIPSSSDRRTVAGIINKRIGIGMPIQVDATVVYIMCEKAYKDCRKLTRADFDVDSPYNTYKYRGLPPTPISNPGVDAIQSAINSEGSSYLYYLSDPDSGKTLFSATLEEHNEKRAIYLGL